MTAPSLSELTAQISFAVESVDVRYRTGELGPADIDDLKRTIDEARLRLWGLLNTASGPEGRVFEERMRIRRAREICARVAGDLEAGRMNRLHKELAELSGTAAELARVIEGDGGKTGKVSETKPAKAAGSRKSSGGAGGPPKRKR
jgi:hypothetical protein